MKGRRSFHIPGSKRHYLPDREYQTEHIRVELKVDPEEKTIEGSCSLTIAPLVDDLAAFHLDASEMHVKEVRVDGAEARFDHDGRRLTVRAGAPLSSGSHMVTVEYSASPTHGVFFVHPDDKYPNKPVQVWTQCESEGARFWFPCHDHPNDKSTSEMVITVPEGYSVISNGRLLSREAADGWTTYHWHEGAPHSTYLNSFVVGKFVEVDDTSGKVPLQYYVPEGKQKDTMRYFGQTPEMMRVFEEITGIEYPYEKYAQVAVHDFIYGGMENISATTLVDNRFPDERTEADYSARYSRPDRDHIELVSHELVHMWFGDLVTLRHWSHAWLNEGFATYMEAVYHERKYGLDEFRQNMHFKAQAHFEEDEGRYRRAIVENDYVYADDIFDTCTYEKAAWMIHQLRGILGDEPFFRGTREYLKRFAYKNAETNDYRRVMEEVSGVSLERYFEQSFFRGGHPEFEVDYSWDDRGKIAAVSVRQVQQTDELTPLFELPVDVVFYTARGRLVKHVRVKDASESYQFELDSEPEIVEFDPEGWLLKKVRFKKSLALLRNQLASSVDVLSRRRAADDLASFKGAETVELLKAAASREQYWSVRAEAARSMGKIGGNDALEALLDLVHTRHRRVRRAVIAALAEFKGDARANDAVKGALFGDESPYNQCEAALSIGKIGMKDAVQTLAEAMKIESPEYGVSEASLEALGYTKSKEAREMIRAHIPYGEPLRVRVGSLKGYDKLGSLEPEDVEVLKEIALKDRDFIVRSQLIELVAELGDRRFTETLRKVAELDGDNRNRRRAAEVLEALASGDPVAAITGLRDEVEKLKDEGREMRDRLSRMERV
ncbi:MAG: M1 family aminopeptidase [Thaumarchaeota archaeon]|nr:M1 family aminopeptidase [Nitrososphaerota archaeon]